MEHVSSQLLDAASLMGLGMAFVFAFLSLTILAIKALSLVAAEAAPAPAGVAAMPAAPVQGLSPQKMAAISAAITQYKNNKKG
ncbi:OadG family protein [Zobellella sp. DQSA1]|uniref:OadG family protein n=1 Tax=Zobellella sp. DQSA1 TaxID=3342386 RepID=UPI0035BF8293